MDISIKIPVRGLPPKKDGANSMWRRETELASLKALRTAAVAAMQGRPPYTTTPLLLTVRIYATPRDGDLDNFISGICDGLVAAHAQTPIDPLAWNDLPETATPQHPIVFLDDALITKIVAERLPPIGGALCYEIEFASL